MGLDNGLICENAPRTKEFKSLMDEYHEHSIEICYWRKCWDFRNEIIEAGLGIGCDDKRWKEDDVTSLENFYLSIPQLENFRDILAKYTDPEYVAEHNEESIWDDDAIIPIMQDNLDRLDYFISLMKQSPGLKVWFYDSY